MDQLTSNLLRSNWPDNSTTKEMRNSGVVAEVDARKVDDCHACQLSTAFRSLTLSNHSLTCQKLAEEGASPGEDASVEIIF